MMLNVYCDLKYYPITFDFTSFLAFASESGQYLFWETDNADVILKALNL